MKRIYAIILLAGLLTPSFSQSYSSLWKKVEQARSKDLPQKAVTELEAIVAKAETERQWGQIMKAELETMDVWQQVSPDSFRVQFERFESRHQSHGGATMAVYGSILSHIYRNSYEAFGMERDSAVKKADYYMSLALSEPELLAETKAKGYEPLMVSGATSKYFDNDLLHVVGIEAEAYGMLNRWYDQHGNREAACLSAFMMTQKNRFEDTENLRKSLYLHTLDSLIDVYKDLPVAAEVAIERFNFMDQASDASAQEKVDYIDMVCNSWPSWPRISILKNARKRIVMPSFTLHFPRTTLIPGKEQQVYVTGLRNLDELKLRVTKVNMTGETDFDPRNSKDLKMINSLSEKEPVWEDIRSYYGLPEYLEVRDTLTLKPLPLGIYLLEVSTDRQDVPVERTLLRVTNLQLIDMDMPGKEVRLIAADATTGKPVSGAKIQLRFSVRSGRKVTYDEKELLTDRNGEVAFTSTGQPISYRVSMGEDVACQWHSMSTYWDLDMDEAQRKENVYQLDAYTDRAIYRPGQTVRISLLASWSNRLGESGAEPQRTLKMTVTDRQSQMIDTLMLTTDEWGVACGEIKLPEDCRTGYCTITAVSMDGQAMRAYRTFRVEEYKRPQFFVELDEYTDAYAVGDTVTVTGRARTYTDLAVQNARVAYSVEGHTACWLRRPKNMVSELMMSDTVVTDHEGRFELRVPVRMPESSDPVGRRFFDLAIRADVTSESGETHSCTASLPLSDKATMVSIGGFEEKVCIEKNYEFSARLLNSAGKEICDTLWYRVDHGSMVAIESNRVMDIDFSRLIRGEHSIQIISREDSVSEKFVVFSLSDRKPVVKTQDWFYIDSRSFGKDAGVSIQLGTTERDQSVYYAIVSERGLLEEGRFVLNAENHNRTFRYKDEWGDGMAVRYSWVRDGNLYTHSESVRRPEKERNLKFEWTTFRDRTNPGNKEVWKAKVSTVGGQGVKAHMMATVFDKSLDAYVRHGWNFYRYSYVKIPSVYASLHTIGTEEQLYGEQTYRSLEEPQISYTRMDIPCYYINNYRLFEDALYARPVASQKHNMAMTTAVAEVDAVSDRKEQQEKEVEVRTDLAEYAAFMPDIVTDDEGNLSVEFDVPQSMTTWRMIGLVHDKSLRTASIEAEVVARKPLMVKVNKPRFLREGDRAEISAAVSNVTSETMKGTTTLYLLDAESGRTVYRQNEQFCIDSDSTAMVTYRIPADVKPGMYICRFVAKAGRYSDGEQDYLSVLSSMERVVRTKALTLINKGTKVVDVTDLWGNNTTDRKLTVEYSESAQWMLTDALAALKQTEKEDAVSTAAAVYAGAINAALNPDSAVVDPGRLMSRLAALQNSDGSFSWCKGMQPSLCITGTVVRMMARLDRMLPGAVDCRRMLERAFMWLDEEMALKVERMKKDKIKDYVPSGSDMDYLYIQAIDGKLLSAEGRKNAKYLLSLMKDISARLTIKAKADMAIVMALHKEASHYRKVAANLLESVKQYTVYNAEMGRYFDTRKAEYSWCDYKIPTQTAAIEAMQLLRVDDTRTIAEMQQWLLQEKRTQQWNTPISTADAVWAFFGGKVESGSRDRGYYRKEVTPTKRTVEFKKTSDGMSFGAVYAECSQPVEDVEAMGQGLSVKREIVGTITKGNRVKVMITVEAERDLDFVEVVDKRMSCLEPVNQLSRYRNGCYEMKHDTETVYCFDKMSKGKHVMETEYFVDRDGDYTMGTVSARCAYAPEFCAVSR